MKILYFGTVVNVSDYENEIKTFKRKPSVASLMFESALVGGFRENGTDLDVYSFPIYPAFPKCPKLFWKSISQKLECGYKNTWLGALNITGFKQITLSLSSKKVLKRVISKEKIDAILIYSVYLPVAKNIIAYAKKYNIPCYAIIPDLPRDMYSVHTKDKLKLNLSKAYTNKAQQIQGEFDGYIYLTEQMKDVINPDKPYTVVEGIANLDYLSDADLSQKHEKRAIMYAGALNKAFGLDKLIEAFGEIDNDELQLWFFGSGPYAKEILEHSKKDTRIKFFGRKPHDEILEFEKKATLLVNVRNCNDEFTKYSFPSKTIEYMLSATPVLTTRLQGIPKEYFDYVFSIDDNDVETIKNKLLEIMSLSNEELLKIGKKAQQFIKENKSGFGQAKKILELIEENNLKIKSK